MTTSNLFPGVLPQLPSAYYGTASGSGTAYTATTASAAKVFGLTFNVASGIAPTLAVNGGTAYGLVNSRGAAIGPGEILDGETRIVCDNSGSYIVLSANSLTGNQIQPISASVAANALTVGLAPTQLQFRHATLNNGSVSLRNIATALSLVVPSAATLGTLNAVASRLVLLVLDNGPGSQELAIVNLSGGNVLDETGVISTTILNSASLAANVVYSATARTNVPYRVVGIVDSTQATAGTWATAPSLVQGVGGEAISAMGSIGYGQTWQQLLGSRALATTYYNTTGKPIQVAVGVSATGGGAATAIIVNGIQTPSTFCYNGSAPSASVAAIIPPGGSYSGVISAGTGTLSSWVELR